MGVAPNGAPLSYDAVTLTIGGLWVELHMSQIYAHIKKWAPLEHGKEPDGLGLLRAQLLQREERGCVWSHCFDAPRAYGQSQE